MGGFDCHQFNDSAACMNHTADNCWWEDKKGFGECFFLDPNNPACFKYDNNQTACANSTGCEWVVQPVNATFNETSCGPAGMSYCRSKANMTECIADSKCLWMTDFMTNESFCGVNMGGGMNPECQTDCTKCSDPGMCGGSPKQCHWNFTASPNRCEDGRMDVNPCEVLFNPTCDNTFGCRYDANYSGTGVGKCVVDTRMNVSGCASYPVNSSCNGDVNCEWVLDQRDNKYKCMSKGSSDCENINNSNNCTANSKCMWDYGFNKCYASFGGGVCESINDPQACKNTAGCKWDDPQWRCVGGSVVNCSAQNTSSMCNMYGECKWNGTACELSPCASDCLQCSNTDACMKSPRGCWWDFGQAKCNPHQEPTCANGMCDMCTTVAECYNTTLHPMNQFCGWFANVSQAPGYQPPPAKSSGIATLLGGGGNFTEPNCRMNTSCAQDCFMCNSQSTCLASNDTAFSNKTDACGWDPLSSWNPCFPKGQGGAGPCNTNCTQCGDQWSCGGSPVGCNWDASMSPPCSQSNCFTLGCSYCSSQDNCMKADGKWRNQNATGCVWQDYGNGTKACNARSCEVDCSLCMTQSACSSSTLNCSWNNQTNVCNFPAGSASGCNADCSICGVDSLCWSSYAGCKWVYEGHFTVDLLNNRFSMPGMSQGGFTLRKNEALYFNNRDNVTHNLTIDSYTGAGFPLTLNASSGQEITFTVAGTHVIYDTILGKAVMNMSLTVTSEETKVCRPNACKNNCGDCHDPGSCSQSYAGCSWEMNTGNCNTKGFGMTCTTDCFACDSELKCNASNASMMTPSGQMNGCQWIFDPIDGANGCRPKGITFDCATMCEMCNQTQCANATPKMLPPEAKSCKWFANEIKPGGGQGMCHPDAFTGSGSNCPAWDYTSKVECESNQGCRWDETNQKCLINSGSLTCDQVCDKCNQTQCNAKSPKCKWDVPPVGQPFCREDYSSGFKSGGNCQQNCLDCYDNQSCTGSTAGCRWVKDAMSSNGYHCNPADMPICEEDCFQCFSTQDCLTSNNSLKAFKSTNYCVWVDQQYFKYCKPNITMEICFAPGDEDNNSVEGCKDTACSGNPFCQFGGGGPMGTDKDCFIWDQMHGGNQSVCECGNATRAENGTCTSGVSVVNGTGCVWNEVPKGNATEGLCDPKFSDMVFTGMGEDMPNFILHDPCQQNEPPWVNAEKNVLENVSFLDICEIGIRDMPNTTAFILNLKSVSDLALCNFLSPSSQNQSGKYYFLLDTDNNASSGCGVQVNITETDRTPSNFVFGEGGFEYRLDYEVGFANGTPTDVRTVYKCVNGSWSVSQATVSGKKDKACEYKSIYYGILKSDIGNPLSTIHIIAFTADASGGWSNNVLYAKDRAYHAYYTPNTIDFMPPDCASNPAACGSGFDAGTGVMTFENCFPGTGDEDKDGKINCADEDCMQSVFCANASTYNASTDTVAPKITSSKVDAEQALVVLIWTTDEPATGVVQFYGKNSTCELGVQNISQYNDAFFPGDDYTPTHVVPLDANNPDTAYQLNYTLEANTTYYYKLRSCDQAAVYNNATNSTNPNCGTSACLNLTTKLPCEAITNQTICVKQGVCYWYENSTPKCRKEIQFGFDWTSNTSNPTDPLGGVGFTMDVCNLSVNVSAGTKVKVNESCCDVTLNFTNDMTMLVGGNAPWTIGMQKCCVPKQTVNLTDALQIANASNESLFLGVTSPVWQQIAQVMGCKKVFLYLPGFHQDCANITITHCNENGLNCTDVSLDNASMVFCNSSVSVWELPGSDPTLFSTYTNEYGIDAYAPRVLSGPTVISAQGMVAAISTTANENCSVSVNYRECDMATYNATGSCAQYPENLTQQGRWAYNATMAMSHTVYLTNLTESTLYYYRVIATDASSNQRILDNQENYYSFNSGTQSSIQQYGLVTGWNLISLPLSA